MDTQGRQAVLPQASGWHLVTFKHPGFSLGQKHGQTWDFEMCFVDKLDKDFLGMSGTSMSGSDKLTRISISLG